MGKIITNCLQAAEELSLKSVTFPAIGTGNLGFPNSVVAKLLFDKVYEFSSKRKTNSLREVHFLLHPKDVNNIQVSYFLCFSLSIACCPVWIYLMVCGYVLLSRESAGCLLSYKAESSLLTVSFACSLSCAALLSSCPFIFSGNNTDESVITLLS